MAADWPGEADEPSDSNPDRHGNGDGNGDGGRPAPAETRSREEYYVQLYQAVSVQQAEAAQQDAAKEQAEAKKWEKTAKESRWMWGEYERKWPQEERPTDCPPIRSPDRNQLPNERVYQQLERACDNIARREREIFSPAMRDIESNDSSRHLIGFKHRLKGSDRVIEKAVNRIEEKNRTPEEVISLIPDAIRYTFQYETNRYTQGVWDDISRLKERGFELVKCKNFWSEEQYKGINSQWIDPGTGQRFEVQFHTRISFEAKQLTHTAYERLRSGHHDEFERMVLKAFQRKVSAEVPIPPGAADIPDYLKRGQNAG